MSELKSSSCVDVRTERSSCVQVGNLWSFHAYKYTIKFTIPWKLFEIIRIRNVSKAFYRSRWAKRTSRWVRKCLCAKVSVLVIYRMTLQFLKSVKPTWMKLVSVWMCSLLSVCIHSAHKSQLECPEQKYVLL